MISTNNQLPNATSQIQAPPFFAHSPLAPLFTPSPPFTFTAHGTLSSTMPCTARISASTRATNSTDPRNEQFLCAKLLAETTVVPLSRRSGAARTPPVVSLRRDARRTRAKFTLLIETAIARLRTPRNVRKAVGPCHRAQARQQSHVRRQHIVWKPTSTAATTAAGAVATARHASAAAFYLVPVPGEQQEPAAKPRRPHDLRISHQ
jgi:hypothetical protein